MPDGILNIYKPSGPTSHDCVARVRRVLNTRRVGHAGTLDPLARGVLVLGVGLGTRVLEYLQGLPKTYRARMVFGLETDSQDTTGRTLRESDASGIVEEQVRDGLAAYFGESQQLPPMVSALKVRGQRLYELARRGETVERELRPIRIDAIELLEFRAGPRAEAEFRVICSAGTYVRTLCHDLGQSLGVGAAMSELEREAIGPFLASTATLLDDLAPDTPLTPLAEALTHLPSVVVEPESAQRLAHGQFIPAPEDVPNGPIRVLNSAGLLLAIATAHGHGEARLFSPEKVLVSADAANTRS